MRVSGQDEVGVCHRDVLGIVRRMRQQDYEIVGRKAECGRCAVLAQVERIAHARHKNPLAATPQGVHLMLQQMHAIMPHFAHDVVIASLVVIVAKHGIGAQRRLHLRQGSHDGRHVLAAFVKVTANQQHVGLLVYEQADQVLQSLLLQQAFVVQVGDKGDAEALEGGRHVAMREVVRLNAADALIGRAYVGGFRCDSCTSLHNYLLYRCRFLYLLFLYLALRRLAADITQIRLVKGEHRRKAGRQPDSIAKLRAVCLHDWLRQRHGNHPLGTAGRQEQQRKNGYVD